MTKFDFSDARGTIPFHAGLLLDSSVGQVDYVITGLEKKMITVAVFLDISKAYDFSMNVGLIYRLLSLNCLPELIRLV